MPITPSPADEALLRNGAGLAEAAFLNAAGGTAEVDYINAMGRFFVDELEHQWRPVLKRYGADFAATSIITHAGKPYSAVCWTTIESFHTTRRGPGQVTSSRW